jgi:uncharacterized C2H2 Zn-finger protein
MIIHNCNRCNKIFRDPYNLQRHFNKKYPCKKVEIQNLQKSQQYVDNINHVDHINDVNNINQFGNEELNNINSDKIINQWRIINKEFKIEYIRAGKLIIYFINLIKENKNNNNTILSNIRSTVTKVYTQNGWTQQPTMEVIDSTIKTRAGQLIKFKEDIINHNDRVFKSESNKKTWYHIEQFNKKGMQHRHGEFQNLQTIRNIIKINLL